MRFFGRYSTVILTSIVTLRVMAQSVSPPPELDAWYSWILVWIFRPGIGAVVAGILMAFIVPQRIKMDFPHTWDEDRRRRTTRRVSFVSGFLPTMLLWPLGWMSVGMTPTQIYLIWVTGFLAAITVGAAAPWSYTIIMKFLYKHGWANADVWSGETHAAQNRLNGGTPQPQDDHPEE